MMPDTPAALDALMEDASVALQRGDYLSCEAGCLRALAIAKQQQWWTYYRRILFPLQEARRHRRTIASEGHLLLGCDAAINARNITDILAHCPACVVLTKPMMPADATQLLTQAAEQRLFLEVLYAEVIKPSPTTSTPVSCHVEWAISAVPLTHPTIAGVQASTAENCLEWLKVKTAAPPETWCKRWIAPRQNLPATDQQNHIQTPAGWFLQTMELLGNAALAAIRGRGTLLQQLNDLERCLTVFADHELMHQQWILVAQQLIHQTHSQATNHYKQ